MVEHTDFVGRLCKKKKNWNVWAGWIWAYYLISLWFCFLIYKNDLDNASSCLLEVLGGINKLKLLMCSEMYLACSKWNRSI